MALRDQTQWWPLVCEGSCNELKHGRFDLLRCVLPVGHKGAHNFVVACVTEYIPRRRPDKEKQP